MRDVTYRGLTLARPDFRTRKFAGFRGHEVRTGADSEQPRGDGSLPGNHYMTARFLEMDVRVRDAALPSLLAAFQPSRALEPELVWIDEDGQKRRVFCRVTDMSAPSDVGLPGWSDVTIGLKASDPRVYGDRKVVGVQPFAVSGGGLDYPVDYPKDYGDGETTAAAVANVGDSDAHPTVRVFGPTSGTLSSWRLTNTTNGSTLQVDTTVGVDQLLTVRLREWVVGDPGALIVELDGASRYGGWVTRPDVLWLSPGDNTLKFEVLDGAEPSDVQVIYRSTFAGTRREKE